MKQQKQVRNVLTEQILAQDINNRGETIKSLKPPKLNDFISELDITTDCVVAKLMLVTNNSTRRVFVYWGDLESDVISIYTRISLTQSPEFGLSISSPDKTYNIFHVYDEPEDRRTFERHVTISIQDHTGNIDQTSISITIDP